MAAVDGGALHGLEETDAAETALAAPVIVGADGAAGGGPLVLELETLEALLTIEHGFELSSGCGIGQQEYTPTEDGEEDGDSGDELGVIGDHGDFLGGE